MQSLIVGFGRAGKDLHLHCLRKARKTSPYMPICDEMVAVVDPKLGITLPMPDSSLRAFHTLVEVRGFDPASTIVHICTAPIDHLTSIRQVANLGYTKIIVEKPLVPSLDELEEIYQLQEKRNLDILVVAVWIYSSLTKQLKSYLDNNMFGSLQQIMVEQHKPRFERTLLDGGHATAFDVEMPHQIVLALYLGGLNIQVINAACTDMYIGDTKFPYMGTAQITLSHGNNLQSTLFSSLVTTSRKRMIRLSFDEYTIEGYFPLSANIEESCMYIRNKSDHILVAYHLKDDPLTACLEDYYTYYSSVCCSHKPISDLCFNTVAISAITQAKITSGIPLPRINSSLTSLG